MSYLEIPQADPEIARYFQCRTQLEVGDLFEDFETDEQVSNFVLLSGKVLLSNLSPEVLPLDEYYGRTLLRKLRSDKPYKFIGRIADRKVLITPSNPDVARNPNNDLLDSSQALSLVILRNMYSTGRGCVGCLQRECIIYQKTRLTRKRDILRLATRPLNKDDAYQNVEWLIRLSRDKRKSALRNALSNPLSAGLPGLGKRR